MRNKKYFLNILGAVLAFCCVFGFTACDDNAVDTDTETEDAQTEDTEKQTLDYSDVVASEYVKDVTYKGFEIELDNENADKEAVLWADILNSAWIPAYPEGKIEYYFEQTKEYYMHTVGYDEDDYLLLLKNRGINEEMMREEAREMVAKDLVYRYIVAAETIEITDGEKQELFEKYVDVYVSDYGYNEEYVLANMTEYIYDSMLYDKTMEFLMMNNTFTVVKESETK